MEAPPPGARGPMRRTLAEVGSWAEGDAALAAAEAHDVAATGGGDGTATPRMAPVGDRTSLASSSPERTHRAMRSGGVGGGGGGLQYEPSIADISVAMSMSDFGADNDEAMCR